MSSPFVTFEWKGTSCRRSTSIAKISLVEISQRLRPCVYQRDVSRLPTPCHLYIKEYQQPLLTLVPFALQLFENLMGISKVLRSCRSGSVLSPTKALPASSSRGVRSWSTAGPRPATTNSEPTERAGSTSFSTMGWPTPAFPCSVSSGGTDVQVGDADRPGGRPRNLARADRDYRRP